MTDDLLRRLQNREPDAQRELFEYCRTQLRPFLLARLPNVGDLDDCVSEVVTRALEGLQGGLQPRVLEAWLTGIAKKVLNERYRAKNLGGRELPDDLPVPDADPPLELSCADLPERVSEYELLAGKRQLWDMLLTATSSLTEGLAPVMRTHMELTLQRGHLVRGSELAEALGQPVDTVNRQLNRGKAKLRSALVSLVLARPGGSSCPELTGLLREVLRPEQLRAGRDLALDPTQVTAVLDHANQCAACAPQVEDARDFSKWALGPGLLGLAEDDEERRRAIIAMLNRAGDGPVAAQAPTAAAASVIPAPLIAETPPAEPAGFVEHVRTAVANKIAMLPRPTAAMRFAQENPEVVRRIVTSVVGGIAAVAVIMGTVAADQPADHRAAPDDSPPAATGPTSPGEEQPVAGPRPAIPIPGLASPSNATSAVAPKPKTVSDPAPSTTAPPPKSTQPDSPNPPPTTTPPPPPPPPPPPADAIDVDASDTDYPAFGISGVAGTMNTDEKQRLRLAPGLHTLTTALGHKLNFRVTDDHRVTYDPALEGTFTGDGSSTLAVHGSRVTLDVSDLDYASAGIGGISQTAERRHTYRLLPGPHYLVFNNGRSYWFTVTGDGHVTYDRALEGQLTGASGPTLAVHGFPITLDGTDVDYGGIGIGGTFQTSSRTRTFRLLPGPHYIVVSNRRSYSFTVTGDGHVGYDPAKQGRLTGDGGTTLAVHGFPVAVDVADVDYVDTGVGGTFVTRDRRHVYRLLPGPHYMVVLNQASYPFTVTDDGHVTYDPGLQGRLTGDGGTTLAVHGFSVTIDATESGEATFSLSGIGTRDARQRQTLRLLPATHVVALPSGRRFAFQLTAVGHVEYDRGLDAVSGWGSPTLIIRRRDE